MTILEIAKTSKNTMTKRTQDELQEFFLHSSEEDEEVNEDEEVEPKKKKRRTKEFDVRVKVTAGIANQEYLCTKNDVEVFLLPVLPKVAMQVHVDNRSSTRLAVTVTFDKEEAAFAKVEGGSQITISEFQSGEHQIEAMITPFAVAVPLPDDENGTTVRDNGTSYIEATAKYAQSVAQGYIGIRVALIAKEYSKTSRVYKEMLKEEKKIEIVPEMKSIDELPKISESHHKLVQYFISGDRIDKHITDKDLGNEVQIAKYRSENCCGITECGRVVRRMRFYYRDMLGTVHLKRELGIPNQNPNAALNKRTWNLEHFVASHAEMYMLGYDKKMQTWRFKNPRKYPKITSQILQDELGIANDEHRQIILDAIKQHLQTFEAVQID